MEPAKDDAMSDTASIPKAPVKAKGKPVKAKAPQASPKAVKPTSEPVKAATPLDQYGYRCGALKSQAASLYAAKEGATLAEVKKELGSVQLNVLKDLERQGYKVTRKKEAGVGREKSHGTFLPASNCNLVR